MHQPDDPPHARTDDRPDNQSDARWLTFEEIARARGISKLSAAALVRRHGWRRQRDNRGRVIALVPNDGPELRRALDNQPDQLPDQRPYQSDNPPHQAAFETALSAIEAAHAREISTLRERADTAQALADRTLGQLLDAERRADRAEAGRDGERARADALRDRLETAQADARQAREAAEALRQDLEAARVAQAEAEADAVELRERHAREIAVAEHDARAVQQAAAELRLAADERKGRGRWARLRAAWRGE